MTTRLKKSDVEDIFHSANEHEGTTSHIILALHKILFPEWDNLESVDGYVRCSRRCAETILSMCIAFDRVNAPDVMAGGSWLNYGFSIDESIQDECRDEWTVVLPNVTVLA